MTVVDTVSSEALLLDVSDAGESSYYHFESTSTRVCLRDKFSTSFRVLLVWLSNNLVFPPGANASSSFVMSSPIPAGTWSCLLPTTRSTSICFSLRSGKRRRGFRSLPMNFGRILHNNSPFCVRGIPHLGQLIGHPLHLGALFLLVCDISIFGYFPPLVVLCQLLVG